MSLAGAIRSAVKVADNVTKSVQITVQQHAWTGQDAFGEASYVVAPYRAILEAKQQLHRRADGKIVETSHKLTILEDVADVAPLDPESPRVNPVDPRDVWGMPDGSIAATMDVAGVQNPETGAPFCLEVMLGRRRE